MPLTSRMYRNDSDTDYNIPGLGWLGAHQRISIRSEFPPPINLANFPGVVDVHEEEAAGTLKDYEAEPEPEYNEPKPEELPPPAANAGDYAPAEGASK